MSLTTHHSPLTRMRSVALLPQVRGLEVESRRHKRHLLLQGVSLEVRGGELMAIMATSGESLVSLVLLGLLELLGLLTGQGLQVQVQTDTQAQGTE